MPPTGYKPEQIPTSIGTTDRDYNRLAPYMTESNLSFDQHVEDDNDLKVEINTFVWAHAPAKMPLGKADELACKLFNLFLEARNEYGTEEP